jgi:hypothetical protein
MLGTRDCAVDVVLAKPYSRERAHEYGGLVTSPLLLRRGDPFQGGRASQWCVASSQHPCRGPSADWISVPLRLFSTVIDFIDLQGKDTRASQPP